MKTPYRPTLRALALAVGLWGCELALARLTSDAQLLRDVLTSALGLTAIAVLPAWAAGRAPRSLRPWLCALAGAAPVGAVLFGLLSHPFRHLGLPPLAFGCLLLGGLPGLLWAWLRGPRGPWPLRQEAVSQPGVFVAEPARVQGVPARWIAPSLLASPLLIAAVGLAWADVPTAPAPGLILQVGAAGLVLLALASDIRAAGLVVPLTLALALSPMSPPEVEWHSEGAAQGPDIIILSIDTLRADAALEMEVVQRLAAEGTLFTQVQSTAPWTLPSMASLMTGQPVSEHGAGRPEQGDGFNSLQDDAPLLADQLAGQGYDTAAVLGANPFVGSRFGFERGFAVFDFIGGRFSHALPREGRRGWGAGRPMIPRVLRQLGLESRRPVAEADLLVDRALSVVDRRRDRPLLLWMHFLDCHMPYYRANETGLPWGKRMTLASGRRDAVIGEARWAEPEGVEALWTAYRHEIGYVDRALMRFLDALGPAPERGRVVVLTSDHGEEFWEHGGFEHGHALWQEVVAIPLVFGGAGVAGRRLEVPVGLHEVAPTLLGLARGERMPGLLSGPRLDVSPELVSENLLYHRRGGPYAVRRGRWKAIFLNDRSLLFDLREDPSEQRDVSAEWPALMAELAIERAGQDGDRAVDLSEAELEQLRALGYIQD